MTHHEARMGVGCHPTPPDYTPRLRLKPKAPRTGYVDGPGGCGATISRVSFQICSLCRLCDSAALNA